MAEPQYKLEGIVHTQSEIREDFEGPLDVIFLLLSKNKIEIPFDSVKDLERILEIININIEGE